MSNQHTELHYMTLTEVASLLEQREISSTELTTSILERIEAVDGTLKSYAIVMANHALAAAQKADAEIAAGQYRGPLHGVSIAVKDLCFTKGVRTMGGAKVLADHVPTYDATVVTRLEAAGAVLLGKLNLTEGALGGYHPELDIPLNPWKLDAWPGSSSSGSGAATAAGLAYGTLGSDTGGSIRFPAAACGVVGLKPTWGRVSRYGVLALSESLDHIGPLTRGSADAAIMFQAIAGHDPNDPTSRHESVPDMLANIDAGVQGLRIGIDEVFMAKHVDPDVATSVVEGVRILASLGAEIVPIHLPALDQFVSAWPTLCSTEAVLAHEATYPSQQDDYGTWFREWLDLGASITGVEYARANNVRAECNGRLSEVFKDIDVLACPTMPGVPWSVDPSTYHQPRGMYDLSRQMFTIPFDFNGAPTLSVLSGFNDDGLPLSLQFVGHHLAEELLCQIGHAYEKSTKWHTHHPAI
ncbi:MAG: amidase [Chloroflexota bacterium]